MREPLARHETFQYRWNEPFQIRIALAKDRDNFYVHNSHWHEELEIVYILNGKSLHYIDGECIKALPGRLVVTNSECIHRIQPEYDASVNPEAEMAVILLIHRRFLKENFPEYDSLFFTNTKPLASDRIREIMLQCREYANTEEHSPVEHLRMRSLLLQLLYYMYEEGTVSRSDIMTPSYTRRDSRIKEILQYVEDHYREPIAQTEVAKRFYFTPQYFSRYFRQNEGITFTEYLTNYRLRRAQTELLQTDRPISEIALNNGFSDDRRFICAFKRTFQSTPLQYRKQIRERRESLRV